ESTVGLNRIGKAHLASNKPRELAESWQGIELSRIRCLIGRAIRFDQAEADVYCRASRILDSDAIAKPILCCQRNICKCCGFRVDHTDRIAADRESSNSTNRHTRNLKYRSTNSKPTGGRNRDDARTLIGNRNIELTTGA